jgi:hypothetical protein
VVSRVAAPVDREQLPVALDTLELPGSAVVQDDVGADDQVAHGPGGEDLVGLGGRHDPGGDVHGHPAHIAVAQLDLADVHPGADLHLDAAQLIAKGDRAVDRSSWAVEGGQDPVAGGLDQAAAGLLDQPAGQLIMDIQQLTPAPVAKPASLWGRADDVGEQHGRQDPGGVLAVPGPGEELLNVTQDELGRLPDGRSE